MERGKGMDESQRQAAINTLVNEGLLPDIAKDFAEQFSAERIADGLAAYHQGDDRNPNRLAHHIRHGIRPKYAPAKAPAPAQKEQGKAEAAPAAADPDRVPPQLTAAQIAAYQQWCRESYAHSPRAAGLDFGAYWRNYAREFAWAGGIVAGAAKLPQQAAPETPEEKSGRARSIRIGDAIMKAWPNIPEETRRELEIARYQADAEWRKVLGRCWHVIEAAKAAAKPHTDEGDAPCIGAVLAGL